MKSRRFILHYDDLTDAANLVWCTVNYREAYGMFACNGILFNEETSAASIAFPGHAATISP